MSIVCKAYGLSEVEILWVLRIKRYPEVLGKIKVKDFEQKLTLDLVSVTVFGTGMHIGVTVFVVFFDGITEVVVFLQIQDSTLQSNIEM